MKKEDTAEKINIGNPFPLDVLPNKVREIIDEANVTLGFPKDYLAMSMLTAMSAAIGNTHKVEYNTCWQEYCILFVALVSRPGANKSHPLSFAMQPLINFDAEQSAIFNEAMKRYGAAMELPPKERVANGYDTNPTEPRRIRFTMQDVTPEAVHRILSENPRGLCLYADELAAGNRNANGFMERFLFVVPDNQSKVKWSSERKTPSFDIVAAWREIISKLTDIVPATDTNGNVIPENVLFAPEAFDRLVKWQNDYTDKCNAEESDTQTAIASKLEIYAVRFCLLLAVADWATGAKKKKAIDTATVERSIRLTEYFRVTAAKVQCIIGEDGLTDVQLAVMSELPDKFTTAEGVAIASKNGMPERTFKRFLREKRGVFFSRDSHGTYTKF